jgi:6-pyruvoyltetrahydropterin/6-carboxytetrahydropterin synthase
MTGSLEIRKSFTFEAGHYFEHMPEDHGYRQFHGHSFYAEVTLAGLPDATSGWIADFADIDAAIGEIRTALDHRLLNDIPGLSVPSLENIAMWIADRLKEKYPNLAAVSVARPSCGESAVYRLG